MDTSSTPVFEYRIGNDSTIYGKDSGVYKVKQDNKSGRWGLNRKIRDLYHIFSPDGKIESDNWHEYDYTRTVNETVVLKPKYQEGKILSGGGIDFNDARVDNQDSKVIAGGLIQIADGQLHNDELKGRTIVTDAGRLTAFYKGKKKRKWDRYDTTKSDTSIYYKQNESVKDLGVFAYKENVAPEFTNNGVANKGDAGDVVLNHLTQSLDKSSLYNVNPNAPKGYVIETDPRFANKQKWLSSDYMFNKLRYNPDNMLKRLGDGFYELRLVNEQINQLTGRRYLEGYQNDLEQYQGLMNNGVHYAKKLNLVPGVALTEKQMSELTTDLVWMVNQEVTLPSGKKINVLTPKIYLASNRTQVTPTGSVISGDSIVGSVKDMTNEGTVLAANLVNLYGQNLENKGLVLADNVNLNADQKLVNLGGKIVAADSLSLYGGKSVELGATTTETQSQLGRTETGNKQVDRQSELKVTGKGGELSIQSGGDITIKAANVKSAGTVDVNAKGKLLVTTEKQNSKEHYDFSDNHHYHLDKEGEVSSVIEGKEGTRLVGQEETTLRQAKVNSEEGRTIIASQGEVKLEEGRDIEHLDRRNKQTSKGFLTKETEEMRRHHDYDLSKGSEVNGKDVIVYSQDANATVKGSSITAQDGLLVQAKNVNVKEAENHAYVEEHYEKKRSGLASSFKGGVAKVGYEKSKSNLDSKSVNLEAAGSQLTAGTATLVAENVLTVRGSDLNSQDQFDLHAKQVNLEAAKEIHHTEVHKTSKTSGFGLSMVYDPTVKAVDQYKQRQKQGGTETVVGKINSIAEAGADAVELMSRGIVPYLEHKRSKSDKTTVETTAKVTALNAGGQLNVVASEGDIRTQGTQIAAEKGATFLASNNIELGTAENTYTQQANTSDKGFSLGDANKYLFGVHTQRENGDATQTQEVSTTISVGGNNQIVAQKGDIHAKGAKIVSEGKNQLSAAGNVVLDTAVTTQETTQQRKGHAVGEAVISDSERFYGYNRTRFNQDGNFTHHEKAQLASLGDKVEVYAGKDYRQTSAEILSKDKASINAQNIIVDSAFNTDKYKQSESDLKFGQFTRVKSPIIDLINSIESTIKNKNASDRVQAANIMSVAAQAYNLASAFQGQGGASYLIRVESGTGVAHSRKKEDSYQHTSQGNLFNAKEIEFTARGDGSTNAQGNPQLGNINITHADITSVDEKGNRLKDSSVTFNANNLTIDPGKSTVDQHARSQSAGVEVGMAATIGAQTGIGIYARVGGSSSKTNVEGVNYTNSHLNTETLNINTQGDTTLTGTTAKAKTINANVGGNLNIASVQDENKFETKSSGGGLEVEFGWGNNWRVSGYGNSEKGESGYKQVKEQAGLFAEEGGYHVNAKNVHLKGAAITSTNPENSELSTNKLTFEDIQNESHSDAMSMSFSASYSRSGGAPKDNSSSGGAPFSQIGSKMMDSFSSNGPKSSSTDFGGGLPMNESDSDNSVTRATLTEGKITLNKDTAPTQTTAQALGINTDINQANGEVDKPKDVNQILSEQRQISAAAGNIKSAVNTYMENQQKAVIKEMMELQAEREVLVKRNDKAALEKVDEQLGMLLKESEEWGNEGKYRRALDAITSAGIAALSGQSAQGIAVTAASPYVNQKIKNATTDEQTGKVNKVTNIAAHALWGAVEGNALGGSGTAGALSAASAELMAPQIAKILYDKTPNELSASEKQRVIALSGVVGKAIGGVTSAAKGDGTYTVSKNSDIGGNIAKNAVENNAIFKPRGENYLARLQQIKKYPEAKNRLLQEMGTESVRNNGAIRSACEVNVAQCRQYIQMLKEARNYYIEEQTKHPEWVYSEEGKMLKTLQSWAEFDIKMAQDILAKKSTQPKSSGVKVEGEIYDTKNPERNKYAHFSVPQGTDIGGSHLVGYPSADRNHEKNMNEFKYYKRWVKDGIISPENVPSSVFKNLANEGRAYTDKKTGKVTKNPDADFFYRLLVEEAKSGNVISNKEYLNSIPNKVSGINKAVSSEFTVDQDNVAYKFAKFGLGPLSKSEIKTLHSLMGSYSAHRGSLGDKIVSSNQAMQYGLLKIGLEKHGLNSKFSDSERNKLVNEMKHAYDIIKIPDQEVAKNRKTLDNQDKIRGSILASTGYMTCKHSGGSEKTCDTAIGMGALVGDMVEGIGNVMGARFDMKNITPSQQLHPYTPDSNLNPKKGSNNAASSSKASTQSYNSGLKNVVDSISNFLSPSRRAEAKANAKANAEEQARKTIENNFYRDQEGFGVEINNYRKFSLKDKTAENVNASQVTDRDGIVRVGSPKIKSDNDILASTGQKSLPYHPTGYPAWKEGTIVTDRRILKPEMMRMVIDEAQYNAILDGKVALGNWATKEPINSISEDMRKRLGVTEEFKPGNINGKPNKFYVVEFQVLPGIGVREGIAGPMYDTVTNKIMPGGVKQINFIDGSPYTHPDFFKIDKNSIREIK